MDKLFNNKYFKIFAPIIVMATLAAAIFVAGPWGSDDVLEYADDESILSSEPEPTPESTPEPTPEPEPGAEDEPEEEPDPTPSYLYNPLTGVLTYEDVSRMRPVAIMLSNVPEALPMNGVSQAAIIYEVLVEGGMTRMLAIFHDFSDVGVVGSIRSARHSYVEIVNAYDAILLHAGGSPLAYTMIRNFGIDNADEVTGVNAQIFSRTRDRVAGRTFSSLHAVITTGERTVEWFPEFGFRLEHSDDFEHALLFTDDPIPSEGTQARDVVVRFSGAKSSTFAFDEANNVYTMYQFNRDFIDANNDELVVFTNLLILRTDVRALTGPDAGAGRRDMDTTGTGEGYFVSNGRMVEIYWNRADVYSPFEYTLRDGTPLELGRGTTYIGLVPLNANITFE